MSTEYTSPEIIGLHVADDIKKKFERAVLAGVAELRQGISPETDPGFLNAIVGEPTLELRGEPTYSFSPHAEALLHFKLNGDSALFQEHLHVLLEDDWSVEEDTVSVALIPIGDDASDVPELLRSRKNRLKKALTTYHSELSTARHALLLVAKEAHTRKALVESFMISLGVPKRQGPAPVRHRGQTGPRNHQP